MSISYLAVDLLAVALSAAVYQVLTVSVTNVTLFVTLIVFFVVMSFALAYQLRATTTLFNAALVIWSVISLVLGAVFDVLYVIFDVVVVKILFGTPGRILLAALLLWAAGAAITESHDEVFEAIDEWYCEIKPTRTLFANVAAGLDPLWEVWSCFWNLVMSFGATAVQIFVRLSLECSNSVTWFDFLREIAVLTARVAEAVLGFLVLPPGPLFNSITIYDPSPTGVDVWKPVQNLLELTSTFDECLCEDQFVQDGLDFLYRRVSSDSLGCVLHEGVNSGLAFGQTTINLFIRSDLDPVIAPNYTVAFERLCAAVICAGDWIDELVLDVQDTFVPDLFSITPIDFKLGCIASRFICVFIELAASLVNFTVEFLFNCFGGCNLNALISDLDLAPVIGRLDELADCTQELFGLFDTCLGEAAGNFVRLISSLLLFFQRLILPAGVGNSDALSDVLIAVNNFVGNTQHDEFVGFVSPLGGIHVNSDTHFGDVEQSSLTCVLSRLLGDGACAKATGDLTNSLVQLTFSPLLIAENLLVTDYSSLNFVGGNPFDNDNRAAFNDLALDLLTVVIDRFLLALDASGHLLQCIPNVNLVGDAVVDLAVALKNVSLELLDLFLLIVETVLQLIIWVTRSLGGNPFGNSANSELDTFLSLFFEILLEFFDLALQILRGIVDRFLFPDFPKLFGQRSALAQNPGRATITRCISDFDDCICGISKIFARKICLPLDIGCLSEFWPGCGVFNPKRQVSDGYTFDEYGKIIPNVTVYEYWADHFNESTCGHVFEAWREGPDPQTSVGELDGLAMLNCLQMAYDSIEMGQNYTHVEPDFFMNAEKLDATTVDLGRASSVFASTDIANILLMYSDAASILGRPEASVEYKNFSALLDEKHVHDEVAISMITSLRSMVHDTFNSTVALLRSSDESSLSLTALSGEIMYNSGRILNKAFAVSVMTLQSFSGLNTIDKITSAYYQLYDVADMQRRQVEAPLNLMEERVEAGYWPFRVSRGDVIRYRAGRFFGAMQQYGAHMLGMPTYSPKYDLRGELEPVALEPNGCSTLYVGCADVAQTSGTPVGCSDEIILQNTRVCQNVFGHAVTTECGENDDGDIFTSFLFWEKFSDCQRVDPLPPLFAFSKFAGDPPLNETDCLDTASFSPDPDPGSAGVICITRDGCRRCPIDQVLPGFNCRFLDEFVAEQEALSRRCIDKLGIGPPIPNIPDNFTAFLLKPFNSLQKNVMIFGKCGNGQIDTEPYNYTNPQTKEVFFFLGEECDPPFSETPNGTCATNCQIARCGDGVVQEDLGEECDNGEELNRYDNPKKFDGGLCTPVCTFNVCGDGNLATGASCEGDINDPLFASLCNIMDPLSCGTNEDLVCVEIEECDDGNRINNDGCSSDCRKEACPRVIVPKSLNLDYTDQFGPCDVPFGWIELTAQKPDDCFPVPSEEGDPEKGQVYSIEVDCKAFDPLVMIYPNAVCDGEGRLEEVQIIRNCTEQPVICTRNFFENSPDCLDAVAVGLDFTCTENCAVCGDGILQAFGGEYCDDGTVFPTGNATEDECINCKFVCECQDDPRLLCLGNCGGGLFNNEPCDPRAPPEENICGDAPCIPHECCGDGRIINDESIGESDRGYGDTCEADATGITNYDPFDPNNIVDSCYACKTTNCGCVPGKPCTGLCFDVATGERARYNFADDVVYFNEPPNFWYGIDEGEAPANDRPIVCNVRDEPFACLTPNQICVPLACCGDNVRQRELPRRVGPSDLFVRFDDFERTDSTSAGQNNAVCEFTLVDPSECPADCNYFKFNSPPTDRPFNRFWCPGFADETRRECYAGRRDRCRSVEQCSADKPCVGLCHDITGTIQPGYYCDRGASINGSESDCTDFDMDWVCGAVTCCEDGDESRWERETIDDICDPTDTPVACTPGDPFCGYDDRWYWVDECTPQAGNITLGRCTYRNDATEFLCDPTDPTFGTSWCNWNNVNYECVPVACCGDGVLKAGPHGYNSNKVVNLDGFTYEPDNLLLPLLETCEDGTCGTSCGLLENLDDDLINVPVFTQCECVPGFTCGGYCVNSATGIALDAAELCNASDPSPQCAVGEICIPQVCCGDGFVHPAESCDGPFPAVTPTGATPTPSPTFSCPTDCGITRPFIGARKRAVYQENLHDKRSLEQEPDKPRLLPRQVPQTIVLTQKSDALTEFIFTIFDYVLDLFGVSTTASNLQQNLIDFVSKTDIDIYTEPEDRGLVWYLVFPFLCRQPANTCCDEGYGALKTLGIMLPWTFLAAIGIGIVFGSGLTSCVTMILGLIWLSIFSGLAWFYAFPGCMLFTVRVPECFVRDISEIFNATNTSCLPWPEGVITDPAGPTEESCTFDTCERDVLDCRAHGFRDGVDTLVYFFERYLPSWAEAFRGTIIFDWLNGFEYFQLTFDRFDYNGGPYPEDDSFCFWVTILNIFQVVAILLAAALLVFAAFQIVTRILDRLALICTRVEYTIFRFRADSRIDDLDYLL